VVVDVVQQVVVLVIEVENRRREPTRERQLASLVVGKGGSSVEAWRCPCDRCL
jgi:hypothetical protein